VYKISTNEYLGFWRKIAEFVPNTVRSSKINATNAGGLSV
jgi:hypothetical protein